MGQGLFWICCHSHLCSASSPIHRRCCPSPSTTSLSSSQCFQQPLDQNSSAATSTLAPGWSLARTPSRWFSFLRPEVSLWLKEVPHTEMFLDVFVEHAENSDMWICDFVDRLRTLLTKCFKDGLSVSRHPRGTRAHQTNPYFRFMLFLLCNEQFPVLSLLPSVPASSLSSHLCSF